MKILTGTPVHEVKDYSMERWLENVSKLQYPSDLLMIDNSFNPEYVEKIKKYCSKFGLTKYKLVHIDLPPDQDVHQRVARSREIIRNEVISNDYDAWFSWECDQIIPTDALDVMIKMMKSGNFMMVNHDGRGRGNSLLSNTDFGVSLISRECLEKYSFILNFGTDPDMPKTWAESEAWLKKRVLRGGGNFIEVYGVIHPIYHLDN